MSKCIPSPPTDEDEESDEERQSGQISGSLRSSYSTASFHKGYRKASWSLCLAEMDKLTIWYPSRKEAVAPYNSNQLQIKIWAVEAKRGELYTHWQLRILLFERCFECILINSRDMLQTFLHFFLTTLDFQAASRQSGMTFFDPKTLQKASWRHWRKSQDLSG